MHDIRKNNMMERGPNYGACRESGWRTFFRPFRVREFSRIMIPWFSNKHRKRNPPDGICINLFFLKSMTPTLHHPIIYFIY